MRGVHCKENPIYVFLFWELRGLSPNFHIHMSVRDLYIPGLVHIFSCSRIDRPIMEIYKSLTYIYECRNWETEHYYSVRHVATVHVSNSRDAIIYSRNAKNSRMPATAGASTTVGTRATVGKPAAKPSTG